MVYYHQSMTKDKQYTEEQIQEAMEILKKKRPDHANREQAINLLDTMQDFSEVFVDTAKKKLEKKALKG